MSVFANALGSLAAEREPNVAKPGVQKGLGAWLINRLRSQSGSAPKLRVLEQIRVTPRQHLVLIEVDGERLLLATSDVSTPAFYPVKKASSGRRPEAIRIEGTCA